MKLLEDRILRDGVLKEGGIVKVDSFLNHQMDIGLINELGREFYRLFGKDGITKILTVEASGIGIACITAQYFGVPVVAISIPQRSSHIPRVRNIRSASKRNSSALTTVYL